MALQFVRFKHTVSGNIKILFKAPNGWKSTTGVVMSEDDWRATGWIMENKVVELKHEQARSSIPKGDRYRQRRTK